MEQITLTYKTDGIEQSISLSRDVLRLPDVLDWIVGALPAMGFPKFDREELEE